MTNFDFLLSDPQFNTFSKVAVAAENTLHIDVDSCVINCRRAMEFAVKWMYSVDESLCMPRQNNLQSLMNNASFRSIVGDDIWRRMDFIRRVGNTAAHDSKKITEEQAELCLENLYVFLDFVAYCYGKSYKGGEFDKSLLELTPEEALSFVTENDIDLDSLIEENKAMKKELTARRTEQQQTYVRKSLDLSEFRTRRIYIDFMLQDSGWQKGKDWLNDVKLSGIADDGKSYCADYVLYGADRQPLAIVEAKHACIDISDGRSRARRCADLIEKKYGRRPVIFITNGFETYIQDNLGPERRCACIYSKRDLEKLFYLQTLRTDIKYADINKSIADRYYQKEAVKAACSSFGEKSRRKALLVMAAGSGKTRTVIALCDILLRHGFVKNILFLADRASLVTQAKRAFENFLPDLSTTDLCEEKYDLTANCVFSTYQTMANCIDSVKDESGKLFTCGHFDLVVCDEAHLSIYNRYRDIFSYFDALLVGLTATPKDEIDKRIYEAFGLENGSPTYVYELTRAVRDGYLVDFMSVNTRFKFIEQSFSYDDLSDEDKAVYEDTFEDEKIPDKAGSYALNEWIFSENTIKQVLHVLMTSGLTVDCGKKLGKTIIFAKNHTHAEKILEIFNKQYPNLPGFAKVIDSDMTYTQSAIDDFSDPKKLPQIAISADTLDIGIDIPEVLNLVFLKKVMSKAKFRQMIGRGTRPCKNLLDGKNKDKFYIFDFCGNFEFFRISGGRQTEDMIALQGAIFRLKAQIAYKLQDPAYQTAELIGFRKSLVEYMACKVRGLNKENFAVRQHLKYVDIYSSYEGYQVLSYKDTLLIEKELAPLIAPDEGEDDKEAIRFDVLMYGIELAYLAGQKYDKARDDLLKKASGVAEVSNIPESTDQSDLIYKILHTDYLDSAGISELEYIRKNLRGLIKYLPPSKLRYNTDFDDEILKENPDEPS